MIKVIHIGDVHFDRPFAGWPHHVSKLLRQGILEAFQRAVDYAITTDADLFILAGDICDHKTMMPQTAHHFRNLLACLVDAGVSVLMVTGNHDPWNAYKRIPYLDFPKGVMVAGMPEPSVWNLVSRAGEPYALVACGHHEQGIAEDVLSKFPRKERLVSQENPVAVIGAAHCMVTGNTGKTADGSHHIPYMPVGLDVLENLGYDYIALGHVHKPMSWNDGRIAYSGSLQGLDVDDVGARGGRMFTWDSGAMKCEFKNFATYGFQRVLVDCQGISNVEGVIHQSEKAMAEDPAFEFERENVLLEIALTGNSPLHGWIGKQEELEWVVEALKDALGVLAVRVDATALMPEIKMAAYMETESFLGELLRMTEDGNAVEALMEDDGLVLMGRFEDDEDRRRFIEDTLAKGREELIRLFVRQDI